MQRLLEALLKATDCTCVKCGEKGGVPVFTFEGFVCRGCYDGEGEQEP
jgi:hypothetical protein